MTFGERIRVMREFKGLSQQKVADAVDVNQTTISAWERGAKYPDFFNLKALAEFFDVSADVLLGLADE